jgi:hypothetical protein
MCEIAERSGVLAIRIEGAATSPTAEPAAALPTNSASEPLPSPWKFSHADEPTETNGNASNTESAKQIQ